MEWECETDASNAALAVADGTVYASVGYGTLAAFR
ncbi:PQQ-binding-like beta-propeller repeat protein [Halostella sp. JP-L12]|nr:MULTISPECIES: PQQ-binding-like beta-propeller repeat protein [Halostella]NHN47063.1 PQQ-binding-like beta-propeller repeat protein [Halostella sp. JP-L12]